MTQADTLYYPIASVHALRDSNLVRTGTVYQVTLDLGGGEVIVKMFEVYPEGVDGGIGTFILSRSDIGDARMFTPAEVLKILMTYEVPVNPNEVVIPPVGGTS